MLLFTPCLFAQIMIGEALMYCMQSHLKNRRSCESSINAGGCNFNSFLRRTVRFVGRCLSLGRIFNDLLA